MVKIIDGNPLLDRICIAPEFSDQEKKFLEGLSVSGIGHIIRYFDGSLAICGDINTLDNERKHFFIPSFLLPSLPNGWSIGHVTRRGENYVWRCRCNLRNGDGCANCIIGCSLKQRGE